jgi:DNA modification methylase
MSTRRRTTTSNFGVGSRESHDATPFYDRFRAPEISDDDTVPAPEPVAEPFMCGDARHMDAVADGSVALVVTSPPYFAGKQYEEELEREGVPSSYLEYLELLTEVFAECVRKLEPGGRIAVNVANLGRKPYRSLSADVIRILEHDLGLLLRGELVWQKGEGASSSCAWGSFRSPMNPVLRDVTERVVIASKGRFDRALSAAQRAKDGLPHEATVSADDFMSLTLDVWSIQPESARRVGHPAPFPVELPEQLVRLYTFADDLVLDPFMGSGSTLLAAGRLGRRYVGYDLDPDYVDLARTRVNDALAAYRSAPAHESHLAAADEGRSSAHVARTALLEAGFTITKTNHRVPRSGVVVSFLAASPTGNAFLFDVAGAFTTHRGGLSRTETVWRTIGRAAAVRACAPEVPFVVLTTELPRPGSDADHTLRAAVPGVITAVVDLLDPADRERIAGLGG